MKAQEPLDTGVTHTDLEKLHGKLGDTILAHAEAVRMKESTRIDMSSSSPKKA